MVFAEAVCIVGGNRETEKRFLHSLFVFFLVICPISCFFLSPFLDIDECKTNSDDCNANAYCNNTSSNKILLEASGFSLARPRYRNPKKMAQKSWHEFSGPIKERSKERTNNF